MELHYTVMSTPKGRWTECKLSLGLAALADAYPERILERLLKDFQHGPSLPTSNKEHSLETRLKLGEVLMRASRAMGKSSKQRRCIREQPAGVRPKTDRKCLIDFSQFTSHLQVNHSTYSSVILLILAIEHFCLQCFEVCLIWMKLKDTQHEVRSSTYITVYMLILNCK